MSTLTPWVLAPSEGGPRGGHMAFRIKPLWLPQHPTWGVICTFRRKWVVCIGLYVRCSVCQVPWGHKNVVLVFIECDCIPCDVPFGRTGRAGRRKYACINTAKFVLFLQKGHLFGNSAYFWLNYSKKVMFSPNFLITLLVIHACINTAKTDLAVFIQGNGYKYPRLYKHS